MTDPAIFRTDLTSPRHSSGRSRFAAALVAAGVALTAASSAAQVEERTSFPAERMRAALDEDGIIAVESATTPGHLRLNLGLWGGYARSPVVIRDDAGNRSGTLLSDRAGGSLYGSLGLGEDFQVGLELPLVFFQGRDAATPLATGSLAPIAMGGIGDLRIAGKWAPIRQSRGAPVNFAVIASVTAPTGGGEAYRGDSLPTFSPELAVSRHFEKERVRLGGNLWAIGRSPVQMLDQRVESEAGYGVGAAWVPGFIADRPVELAASFSGAFSLFQPFQSPNQIPMEVRGQVGHALNDQGLFAFVGGGAGILPGWGTPDWRAFAGLRWSPRPPPPPPPVVECAAPEPAVCEPPPAPPPPPPADRDGDGIPDDEDECVNEAGPASNVGCPVVVVPTTHIEIVEPVNFAFNSDRIEESSFDVLRNVARVLLDNPDIEAVEVEGHTDGRGRADYNLHLSQRRAASVVRFLMEQGVSLRRLTPMGYGASRPIATNDTQAGRDQNRRVVFRITRRAGVDVTEDAQ